MYKNIKAFTLVELMVVLAIVGILVLLALPNLMPLITKTKSLEAKIHLEHIYNLQKSYYYIHSTYTDNLNALGYEEGSSIIEGGNANYQIEIVSFEQRSYVAQAVSYVDFDGDGQYNTWTIDQDKKLIELISD